MKACSSLIAVALLALLVASPTDAAKPKKTNQKATDALWEAVTEDNAEAARSAIKAGADLDARNKNNATPLMAAAEEGKLGVVNALLEAKPGLDGTHPGGATALIFAASNKHPEVAMALVNAGAAVKPATANGWTALHSAAEFGFVDLARAVIAKGADVNARGADGWTPVMFAVENGHAEILEVLLEKGADVDALRNDGLTALMIAAGRSDLATVQRLLKAGAEVDKKGAGGRTAINAAAIHGSREVVATLLKAGAPVDATEEAGWQPIQQAAFNGRLALVQDLLKAGADKKAKTGDGQDGADLARGRGFLDVYDYLRGMKTAPAARFALNCEIVGGPVAATLSVEGPDAFLRVEYPKDYHNYRSADEVGIANTRLYLDTDAKPATGIDFDDALKGMDRSVEIYEMGGAEEGGSDDAVNGKVLVSKVYQHDGGMANSVGDFEPAFVQRTAVARLPLELLGVKSGTKTRGVLQVGESCRSTAQSFVLAVAPAKPVRATKRK
jgi:ankyrin repeat protein